jgi:predicted ArsR family transcriptional regulator
MRMDTVMLGGERIRFEDLIEYRASSRVLLHLQEHGPAYQKKIERGIEASPHTMKLALQFLIDNGLVAFEAHRGRRRPSGVYSLTKEGRALAERMKHCRSLIEGELA